MWWRWRGGEGSKKGGKGGKALGGEVTDGRWRLAAARHEGRGGAAARRAEPQLPHLPPSRWMIISLGEMGPNPDGGHYSCTLGPKTESQCSKACGNTFIILIPLCLVI